MTQLPSLPIARQGAEQTSENNHVDGPLHLALSQQELGLSMIASSIHWKKRKPGHSGIHWIPLGRHTGREKMLLLVQTSLGNGVMMAKVIHTIPEHCKHTASPIFISRFL